MQKIGCWNSALEGRLSERSQRRAEERAKEAERRRESHLARYGEFHVHNNGTATIHGLQWMRCSLGQQWEPDPENPADGTCSGDALQANLDESLKLASRINDAGGFAGHTDWRLPTITELEALRLCSTGRTKESEALPDGKTTFRWCDGEYDVPTIDSQVFPNTPSGWFRSSSISPRPRPPQFAWIPPQVGLVYFRRGLVAYASPDGGAHIRLVRAGQ